MMTGLGMILGTTAYMSPEQARGKPVDQQTDVWAFGCVLFEALTASPAFNGEDVPEILADIMKSEPDWGRLPADTPDVVRSLLRQCLQKQSRHRLHSAGAAKIMLEDAIRESSIAEGPASVSQTSRTGWKKMLPLLATSMLAGAFGVWALRPPASVDRGVTRVLLDVKPAARFNGSTASVRPSRLAVAVSPDGRTVYVSGDNASLELVQLIANRMKDVDVAVLFAGAGIKGGTTYDVKPGDWLAIPPNAPHWQLPQADGGMSYLLLKVNVGLYPGSIAR
jgi:serine/threonine-protein kinase